tara:strand:+ start:67 stop:924 length:858 start_codon:yes stop_codon:yes gene_type:complete
MNILSIKDSNTFLINLIQKEESFIISRLGIGAETYLSYCYSNNMKINFNHLKILDNNAGIYNINKTFITYCDKYINCLKSSSALATFSNAIVNEQTYFLNTFNIKAIHSRILEPFYCCLENIKPWSHYLIGKKVLIINPFVESFKKQIDANFQIFKDPEKKIFLDGQQFIFYKSFQTAAGNHLHSSWIETYEIMCNDIKDLDFDIALLGCGGYGLPLCNFIKQDLNKSAIYIGGGLQLLFGVMGKRWENNEMWNKIIKENDTKFIKPSAVEILKNNEKIEGGCYW